MELDELRAFLAVTDAGSLTGASRASGMSRSTLRRRLQTLEESLKTQLFDAAHKPTARARSLAPLARQLIAHADQVAASARGTEATKARTVVIVVHASLHPSIAFGVGAMLRHEHPNLTFDLRVRNDAMGALAQEGDLAISIDTAVPDSGAWVSRRIKTIPLRLRASQDYVDAHGLPDTLEGLDAHDVVTCSLVGDADMLPLRGGGTRPIRPLASSDDLRFCGYAVRSGFAIALAPPLFEYDGVTHTLFEDEVGIDVACRLVAPGGLSTRPHIASVVEGMLAFSASVEL
jgi:DNA-binding transcriptional LysR family regulator